MKHPNHVQISIHPADLLYAADYMQRAAVGMMLTAKEAAHCAAMAKYFTALANEAAVEKALRRAERAVGGIH